jgi:Domain of unknown function (DUF4261)
VPTKGVFTQCLAILCAEAPTAKDLEETLSATWQCEVAPPADDRYVGGPGVSLDFRPDVGGQLAVDILDEPWPDRLGEGASDPDLYSAWKQGAFGPATFPEALERAKLQSWAAPSALEAVEKHRACIRIRTTYASRAPDEASAAVTPLDHDSRAELQLSTDVAAALASADDSRVLFAPAGEVIREAAALPERIAAARGVGLPPLDLWINTRAYAVEEGWHLVDTVGAAQLGLPDVELALPPAVGPDPVVGYAYNVIAYLVDEGDVLRSGDAVEGPDGQTWQVARFDNPLVDPPRDTVLLAPEDAGIPKVFFNRPTVNA